MVSVTNVSDARDEHWFFASKPCGVTSHRSEPDEQGFHEWRVSQYNQSLYICHRLDKETSGAMVFAKSKELAAQLGSLFQERKVKKEYWLVSDRESRDESWTVEEKDNEESPTTRVGQDPLHRAGGALTTFEKVATQKGLSLYKAYPLTGKTHQIRKHAVKSGIPILGDTLYGDRAFCRLMLHSYSLSFPYQGEDKKYVSSPSRLFRDLHLCLEPELANWICAYERRESLFPKLVQSPEQSARLFHQETGDLRGDKVGPHWILGWWQEDRPTDSELNSIEKLMKTLGQDTWSFHWRPSKAHQDNPELVRTSTDFPQRWVFQEGEVKYQAALDRGHNFGLFLDQRDRRQWVRENSQNLSVLNLFAFTCGFSLVAALGGAKRVVSVDSMGKYLRWGQENFQLNKLESKNYEFVTMDSLDYLNFIKKKGFKFDMIICDPPSFSRQKKTKKVFKIEKDAAILLKLCSDNLHSDGTLLFSTNFEKWDLKKWRQFLQHKASALGFESCETSFSQWDYELGEKNANLKAFILKKA